MSIPTLLVRAKGAWRVVAHLEFHCRMLLENINVYVFEGFVYYMGRTKKGGDSVEMIDAGADRANAEQRGWMEPPCACPK